MNIKNSNPILKFRLPAISLQNSLDHVPEVNSAAVFSSQWYKVSGGSFVTLTRETIDCSESSGR